jgi:hypothetical protein
MSRLLGYAATAIVMAWVIAHLLYLGPILDATERTLAWLVTLGAGSSLVAAVAVLVTALLVGGASPAWLRFAQAARTGAALLGGALIVVGLLHYRDTGQISWVAIGLAVLAGAGLVHVWVLRTVRRTLG